MVVAWGIFSCTSTSVATMDPKGTDPGGLPSPQSTKNDFGSHEETVTDEVRVTLFATCAREHGFFISDPVLFSDGSVNLDRIKEEFAQDPEFRKDNYQSNLMLDNCTAFLAGTTFSKDVTGEDEIASQDALLRYADCLRTKGLNIPDPRFANGTRMAMKGAVCWVGHRAAGSPTSDDRM
jgi:hypothetical protein